MYSVAILGKGRLACHILRSLRDSDQYKTVAVVPSSDPLNYFEKLDLEAERLDIPVLDSMCATDKIPSIDLLICSSYDRIFSQEEISKHGRILNFHNSLLPAFRGTRPINWALEIGSKSHGVTLHEIDKGVDTGLLIDKEEFSITERDQDVLDVYLKCVNAGRTLFERNLRNLMTAVGTAQSISSGSYYDMKASSGLVKYKNLSRDQWKIARNLPL
jgi:methionyl-tRNA formyltransferase